MDSPGEREEERLVWVKSWPNVPCGKPRRALLPHTDLLAARAASVRSVSPQLVRAAAMLLQMVQTVRLLPSAAPSTGAGWLFCRGKSAHAARLLHGVFMAGG